MCLMSPFSGCHPSPATIHLQQQSISSNNPSPATIHLQQQSISSNNPSPATIHLQPWSMCISRKHFRLRGVAPSEWTRSVRAVGDTPVADHSAPGLNTTRRVAYLPPIAVSPFLLALSVSYFQRTLWRCGQL